LDFHRRKIQAIFKIQSTVSMAFREHFVNKGFIEMQPPSIIGSSSEGGTELFEAKYFEKKAFLAQSPQLYKQMVACSMGKAMTITPVWRAEKHNTIRHLNECRQMDIEMAFADSMVVMNQMEDVVKYIVEQILKKNKEELDILELKLKVPKAKYMTFKETADLLKKNKISIEGDDLTPEAERKLNDLFPDTIVFVHDWPIDGRTDLYALGAVMYETMSGVVPIKANTVERTMGKILTEEPVHLSDMDLGLKPEVADTVMRLLAKKPDDRYQTAEETVAALEALITP